MFDLPLIRLHALNDFEYFSAAYRQTVLLIFLLMEAECKELGLYLAGFQDLKTPRMQHNMQEVRRARHTVMKRDHTQ